MTDDLSELRAQIRDINRRFMQLVPHNMALGMVLQELEFARAEIRLPYQESLVGNPETGVLHGGAISALIDATCGSAVFQALDRVTTIATLDLRIDYLKPATPGRDVIARAHCYKVTRQVAFVRASAFHDDEADPIATSSGTFMLGTRGSRREEGR